MMRRIITAFALVATLAANSAASAEPIRASGHVVIIDGDTLKIDAMTIRIVEIDTPETFRSRCENELVLGLKAKERLAQLVRGGADVTYKSTGIDRFGRTLAHVFAGSVNVGEVLMREGHALHYEKGSEAKAARLKVWCGPQAELPVYKPTQLLAQDRTAKPDETIYYPNCAAARAAGAAPIRLGEPGYSRKLDRDGDGVACE